MNVGRLVDDWKNRFTGVFALSNSTDALLYCKNNLVSSQNALSTEDFIFIWFLANAATKFHIFVRQWARKCYIVQKHFVMTFFQQILNTYNCHNNLIFLHVKIYVLKIEIQKIFFCFFNIIGIKKLINKYSPFFRQFFGGGDGGGGRWFWHVKSAYSDRKILHLPGFQVSYGVLGRLFFFNWPGSSEFKRQTWDMDFYIYKYAYLYLYDINTSLGPNFA